MEWLNRMRGATRGLLDNAVGNLEVGAAIGSSIASDVPAGYAGLLGAASGGMDRGADWTRSTGDALSYTPRTPAAKQKLADLGYAIDAAGRVIKANTPDAVRRGAAAAGDKWYEASAASPALAAIGAGLAGTVSPDRKARRAAKAVGAVEELPGLLRPQAGPPPVYINVGLVRGKDGELYDPREVDEAIGKLTGMTPLASSVRMSNTEPTAIFELPRALTPDEGNQLAGLLGQEAIAQRTGSRGGPGLLFGPKADEWGPFNEEFFLDPVGDRDMYPALGLPTLETDKNSGKRFLSKGETPESKAFMDARKKAQREIEAGNYTPMFDPEQRFDADVTKYDARSDTTQYARPKKEATVQQWRSRVQTDDARQRLRAAYQAGVDSGGHERWYQMGQLERAYMDELGEDAGRKAFQTDFAEAMAATTGGASPTDNLLQAAFANFERTMGRRAPQAGFEAPSPVGGRYFSGNMAQYNKVVTDGAGLDPAGQPKRYNFAGNFLGDTNAVTIDEQMTQVITPGQKAPPGDSYFAYEELVRELAKEAGVSPREYQEVVWGGTKAMSSKGGYKGKPMIAHVNEAIERTARVTGRSQDEVLKGLIRRNRMLGNAKVGLLAGVAGLGGLGAYFAGGDDEPTAAESNETKRRTRTERELKEMGL